MNSIEQTERKIVTPEEFVQLHDPRLLLADSGNIPRSIRKKVIQCSGCFDLLHMGHVIYLQEASLLGDCLVVTVNTDRRLTELKGRLICTLGERCYMLASLSCVDYVIVFEEDTPEEIIRILKPDIYVKGSDYIRKPMPEASAVFECGGAIHCIPASKTYDCTTTSLLERINEYMHAVREGVTSQGAGIVSETSG